MPITVPSRARFRNGIENATARAVSVLPFQAMAIRSPSRSGRTGRCDQQRPAGLEQRRLERRHAGATASAAAGRPGSGRHPPQAAEQRVGAAVSARQSAVGPAAVARPQRRRSARAPAARGSPCRVTKSSNAAWARSARSRASRSNRPRGRAPAATKPSAPAAMMSGWPGRTCSPSM
jgi:hypothetical protein